MNEGPAQPNPAKVRIGLAMISVVFVATVVLVFVVETALAQAIFVAIAVLCIVRIALLARSLRNEGTSLRGG